MLTDKLLTVHFWKENISKDIDLNSLTGQFEYYPTNDPYRETRVPVIYDLLYIDGTEVDERVKEKLCELIYDNDVLYYSHDFENILDSFIEIIID